MKHWDLSPGEAVWLHCAYHASIHVTFLFRTTIFACFDTGEDWLELQLLDTGSLRGPDGHTWTIAGRDRQTRTLADPPARKPQVEYPD